MTYKPQSKERPRHLAYFIELQDDRLSFHADKAPVSQLVIDELDAVTQVIFFHQPILISWEVVNRNYQELLALNAEFELVKAENPQGVLRVESLMDLFTLAVQRTANVLSSSTAFLDQVKKIVRSQFGGTSEKFSAWDETRKDFHAARFSYRFMYELRNYSQHRRLPLSGINVEQFRKVLDQPLDGSMRISLKRNDLINSGYSWKELIHEIEKLPEEIEVLPLVGEYLNCLARLCLTAVGFEAERLRDCVHCFYKVRRKLKAPQDATLLLCTPIGNEGTFTAGHGEFLPTQQVNWISDKVAELREIVGDKPPK